MFSECTGIYNPYQTCYGNIVIKIFPMYPSCPLVLTLGEYWVFKKT